MEPALASFVCVITNPSCKNNQSEFQWNFCNGTPFFRAFFSNWKNTHAYCSAPTLLFCVIFFNVEISRSAALPLLPSGTCTSYPPTPLVSVYNLDQQLDPCQKLGQSLESSLISSNGSGSCDRTLNINPREGKDYTW